MERLTGSTRGSEPLLPPANQFRQDVTTDMVPADLSWIGAVLRKHWLWIFLAVLGSVLPTLCYIRWAKSEYRSTVTIQVNPEAAKVLPYRDVSDSVSGAVPNFDLYMKTQDELLRSKLLHDRVGERLRADRAAGKFSGSPEELTREPEIVRVEGSQIFKLSFVSTDPKLAAAAANTWAEEFIKLHLDLRYQTSKRAVAFLQEQLNTLKAKVQKAEEDMILYARSHQMTTIDAKQEDVIRQKFTFLNGEVARAEKDFIATKAQYQELKTVSLERYPEYLKDAVITAIETRALAAEQELVKLQAQFDERWPAVVQKKREVALLKTQLTEAKKNALNRAVMQAEVKYNAARAEYQMLNRTMGEQAALVNQLNQASVEYNSLRREFETGEQLYQGLLQRLKETGVSAGLEFGNIQIADRARPESEPYRPRKVLSLGLALMLGLLLGTAVSFGREFLDRTIRDPWAIEQLGLPLLGWTPKIANQDLSVLGAGGRPSRLLLPLPADESEPSPAPLSVSQSQAREAHRVIAVSVLLSQAGGPPKTILITSAIPREGKTSTAVALGIALAEMGGETLLIDADFRSRALSASFGFDAPIGFSTYLAGGALQIEKTSVKKLSVIPAGTTPPNPAALLNSARFEEAIQSLQARYRTIIVDGPPVLSVADANVLAAKTQAVVFVVNAESTPVDVVRKAVVQLSRTGCAILGGVVNQMNIHRTAYAHYGKYYYDKSYVSEKAS